MTSIIPQKPASYSSLKPGQLLLIRSPYYPDEERELLVLAAHTSHVTQPELKLKLKYDTIRTGPVPVYVFSNNQFKWITLQDIYGIVTKEYALSQRRVLKRLREVLLQLHPYQAQQLQSLDSFCGIAERADGKNISLYEAWLRESGQLDPDEVFEDTTDFGEWLDPLMRCVGVDVDDDEFDLLEIQQENETKLLKSGISITNKNLKVVSPLKIKPTKSISVSLPTLLTKTDKNLQVISKKPSFPNNKPQSYDCLKPGMFLIVRKDQDFPRICLLIHVSETSQEALLEKLQKGHEVPYLPVLFLDKKEFGWINLNEIIEWQVTGSTIKSLIERSVSKKETALTNSLKDASKLFTESFETKKSPVEIFLRQNGLLEQTTPYVQYENCGLWADVVINESLTQRKIQWIIAEQKIEMEQLQTTMDIIRATEIKEQTSQEPATAVAASSDDSESTNNVVVNGSPSSSAFKTHPISNESTEMLPGASPVQSSASIPSQSLHTDAPTIRTHQRPCQKLKPGTLTLIGPRTPAITLHPTHLTPLQLNIKRHNGRIQCVPLLTLTEKKSIVWKNPSELELLTRKEIQNFHQKDKSVPIWNQMIRLYTRVQRAGWSLLQQVLRDESLLSDHETFSEHRKIDDWLELLVERASDPDHNPISKREMVWLVMRQDIERKILSAEPVTTQEIEEAENYDWKNAEVFDSEQEIENESNETFNDSELVKSETPGFDKRFPHRKPFERYIDVVPGTLVVTKYFGKRPTPCFVVSCDEHLTHDALKEKMRRKTLGPIPVLFLDDLTYTWAWLKDIMLLSKEECYESYDPSSRADDLMKGYKEAQELFEESEQTGKSIFEIFLRRVDLLEDDEEYVPYDDFGQWLNALKMCDWFKPSNKQLADLKEKQRRDVILLDEQDEDFKLEDQDDIGENLTNKDDTEKSHLKRKDHPSSSDKRSSKISKNISDYFTPTTRSTSDRPKSEKAEEYEKDSTVGIYEFFNDVKGVDQKKKTFKKIVRPTEKVLESNIKKARAEIYFSILDDSKTEPALLSDYKTALYSLYKVYQYTTNGFLTIDHLASSRIHLLLKALRESSLPLGDSSDQEVYETIKQIRGLSWLLLTMWSEKGWLSELLKRAMGQEKLS